MSRKPSTRALAYLLSASMLLSNAPQIRAEEPVPATQPVQMEHQIQAVAPIVTSLAETAQAVADLAGGMSYQAFRAEFLSDVVNTDKDSLSALQASTYSAGNEQNTAQEESVYLLPASPEILPQEVTNSGSMQSAGTIDLPVYGFEDTYSRTFQTATASGTSTGKLIGQGDHCNIWLMDTSEDRNKYTGFTTVDALVSSDGKRATDDAALEIVKNVDIIYDRVTAAIPHAQVTHELPYTNTTLAGDVDQDGKINVLIYKLTTKSASGYFASNTFSESNNVPIDAFHMDLGEGTSGTFEDGAVTDYFYHILAHEFQHMLHYTYLGGFVNGTYEDLWINESLSGVADIYFSNYAEDFATNPEITADMPRFYPSTSSEQSYANGTAYGDFLKFNNSSKSYGMSYMFAAFMMEKEPEYLERLYQYFDGNIYHDGQEDANATYNFYQASTMEKIYGEAFQYALSEVMPNIATLEAEVAFQYIYDVFMESFISGGGDIIEGETTLKTPEFISSTYQTLWSGRNGNRVYNEKYADDGTLSFGFYTANPDYPVISSSNGAISLVGYPKDSDQYAATHETGYTLDTTNYSSNTTALKINVAGTEDDTYRAYVVLYDTSNSLTKFDAVGNPSFNWNQTNINEDHGDVYPLVLGKDTVIPVENENIKPFLFVTTYQKEVNTTVNYSWETVLEPVEITLNTKEGTLPDGVSSPIMTDPLGKIESLPIPTKAGYTFLYWTLNEEVSNVELEKVDENTIFTTDSSATTIYAQWTPTLIAEIAFDLGDENEITLEVGETKTQTPIVLPEDVLDASVTWSSDTTAVATVDENGEVTALSVGTANITATAQDAGGTEGGYLVTVIPAKVPVTAVSVSPATEEDGTKFATFYPNDSATFQAEVTPANATNQTVTWSSSNEEIATVVNGVVTAVAVGQTTITATSVEDENIIDTVVVEVRQLVTSVSLDTNTKIVEMNQGATITATVSPEDAYNKVVTWSSSNEGVATVNENGEITPVKVGTTAIKATATDGSGKSATCTVTVVAEIIPVTGVTLDPSTLSIDYLATETLTATIAPADATKQEVTWTSSNEEVATVDENGAITTVKAGQTTITVTTEDGGFTATCTVTVNKIADEITFATGAEFPYSGSPVSVTATATSGTEVTYLYKEKDGDDATYTATAPTDVGSYTVQATVADSDNYTGVTKTLDFTIVPAEVSGSIFISYTDTDESTTLNLGDVVLVETVNVTPEGGTPSYQWVKVVDEIPSDLGTDETYTLTEDDTKGTIHCEITYSGNTTGTITTNRLDIAKETLIGTVTIDGEGTVGQVLTATVEDSNGENFNYQWMRAGSAIPGATQSAYTVVLEDLGKNITVKVSDDDFLGALTSDNFLIQGTIPDAPVVTATPGDGQVSLRWTAPFDGGSDITGYQLTITAGGVEIDGSPFTIQDNQVSRTVTGLTNDTEYTFTLVATNEKGDSAPSEAVTATPKEVVIVEYTITFYHNKENLTTSSQKTTKDQKLQEIPVLEWEGYSFQGWFTKATEGEEVRLSLSTVFMADQTYYAQWLPIHVNDEDDEEEEDEDGDSEDEDGENGEIVTITFDPNGGTLTTLSQETGTNGKLESLPIPIYSGYTFDGWFTTATGGSAITTDTYFSEDTKVYAHWTEKVDTGTYYTITFDPSGGTTLVQSLLTNGFGQLTALPAASRGDFTFKGWFTMTHGGTQVTTSTQFSQNTTIYAQWNSSSGSSSGGSGSGDSTGDSNGGTITPLPDLGTGNTDGNVNGGIFYLPIVNIMTSQTFSDMNNSDWYYSSARFVYERGLMGGTGSGDFSPDLETTRGMIVTVLHNMAGKPSASSAGFSDVGKNDWYADAANWAKAQGIVTGTGYNAFDPNGDMTREQLVVMLYSYDKEVNGNRYVGNSFVNFNDSNSISSWALEATAWCVSNGIVAGKPSGGFDPKATASRAEVAVILENFIDMYY